MGANGGWTLVGTEQDSAQNNNGWELVGTDSPQTSEYAKPGPYVTKLGPQDEQKFQSWVKQNRIPWQDSPTADYDMRGYWKAQRAGDQNAKQAANQHFPDTYKTPYHKTFSNESKYAKPNAPHWDGDRLIAENGDVVADETPAFDPQQAAEAELAKSGIPAPARPSIPQPDTMRLLPNPIGGQIGGDVAVSPRAKRAEREAAANTENMRASGPALDELLSHPGELAGNMLMPGMGTAGRGAGEVVTGGQEGRLTGALRGIEGLTETGSMLMGPAALESPASLVKGLAVGTGAYKAVGKGADVLHLTPKQKQLAQDIAFYLPGFVSSAIGLEGGIEKNPTGGVSGKVTAFGDKINPATGRPEPRVGAGFETTPEAFRGAVKVGGTRAGVEVPRAGNAAPQPELPAAPVSPAQAEAQASTASAIQALSKRQATEQAASVMASGGPIPPPPIAQPPTPEAPKTPISNGHVAPELVEGISKAIQSLPAEKQPQALLEAHQKMSEALLQQGKVIGPDGKLHVVENEKQASKLAQDWLNDKVDEIDAQREEQAKAASKVKSEPVTPSKARAASGKANGNDWQLLGTDVGSSKEPVIEESRKTVDAQVAALQAGRIPAVFIPSGSGYRPQAPEGMKTVGVDAKHAGGGIYLYDPKQVSASTIRTMAKNGEHGKLLGNLQSKAELNGKPAVIVQAQGKNGTPIQDSAVDASKPEAAEKQAAILQARHPEATIEVKPVEQVLNERLEATAGEQKSTEAGAIVAAKNIAPTTTEESVQPVSQTGNPGAQESFPKGSRVSVNGKSGEVVYASPTMKIARVKFDEGGTRTVGLRELRSQQPAVSTQPESVTKPRELSTSTEKYKFGSSQHNLQPRDAEPIKALAAKIPDGHLAGNGREDSPHITVRYGLKGEHPESVRSLLENHQPFTATMGKTAVFPPSESSDGAAVLHVPIDSPELHRLHEEIGKVTPVKESDFDYKPHATVAYLKPDVADRYKGLADLEGKTVTIDRIATTGRDGSQREVRLGGQKQIVPGNSDTDVGELKKKYGIKDEPRQMVGEAPQSKTKAGVAPSSFHDAFIKRFHERNGRYPLAAEEHAAVERADGNYSVIKARDLAEKMSDEAAAHTEKFAPALKLEHPPTDIGVRQFIQSRPENERPYAKALWQALQEKGAPDRHDVHPGDLNEHLGVNPADYGLDTGDVEFDLNEDLRRMAEKPVASKPEQASNSKQVANEGTDRKASPVPSVPEPSGEGGNSRPEVPAKRIRAAEEERGVEGHPGAESGERVLRNGGREEGGSEPARSRGAGDEEHPAAGREEREGADGKPVEEPTPPPVEQAVKEAKSQRNNRNFHINDEFAKSIGVGGEITRLKANLEALELYKELEREGVEFATPAQRETLAKYLDFGGLTAMFNRRWEAQYKPYYDKLHSILSEEEVQEIKETTINTHHTSLQVVDWMWKIADRLGFKGGRILEPSMGIGNFFGRMPAKVSKRSELFGVEKNPLTGQMAKWLYPDAKVKIDEFQKFLVPDNGLDFVIGNVPFSEVKVIDPLYRDPKMSLHNYFLVKSLDKVRPGGIAALITSRYTMDSNTESSKLARSEMNKRADLVAAIRLPDTAFKAHAGTEVVTDLLIFRKRGAGEVRTAESPLNNFQNLTDFKKDGYSAKINEYWQKHPEMILGEQNFTGSMYRAGGYNVQLKSALEPELQKALEKLPENIYGKLATGERVAPPSTLDPMEMAPENVKPGSFFIDDKGQVFTKENGVKKPLAGDLARPEVKQRIREAVALRDKLNELIGTQLATPEDEPLKPVQKELNQLYDAYREAHGPLHAPKTAKAFGQDPEYPKLLALENFDPQTKEAAKSDLFSKRTMSPYEPLRGLPADNRAAMLKVLADQGWLNTELMAKLAGKSQKEVHESLEKEGLAFRDPVTNKYVPSDDYLSGDVRGKLKQARAAAENDAEFKRNAEALEKVQPEPLSIHEIQPKLGMTWIPTQYYESFIRHLANSPYGDIKITRDSTGRWSIALGRRFGDYDLQHKWSAGGLTGDAILEYGLNQQPIVIRHRNPDGSTSINQVATVAARTKLQEMKDAFTEWMRGLPAERTKDLEDIYNDTFNGTRLREFDGSHLSFPGFNTHGGTVEHRSYQRNAIWRIIQDGKALLAHDVGLGKTITMMSAGMELRRTGLSRKNMYAVPNHMVEQWRNDFKRFYPGANVLMVTDADFTAKNRQKLMSRIATGDWDAVIVPHSQVDRLPMSPEWEEKVINEKISGLRQALEELNQDRSNRKTVKQIEKRIDKYEARLLQLNQSAKDQAIYFDHLGTDMLLVDEAQAYKAMDTPSRQGQLAGISNRASQRALQMEMKTRFLLETHKGRGVVFATGTPITNTLGELYNITRYLAPEKLEAAGIRDFDDWTANFASTVTNFEYSPDGVTFRPKTALAEFTNVPELQNMSRTFGDYQSKAQAKLKEPKPTRHDVTVKTTDVQAPLLLSIAKRGAKLMGNAGQRPDPSEDNWLKLSSDARKISLDPRLYDPSLPDDPDSKVNAAAKTIAEIYKANMATKSGQLVFSDFFAHHRSDGKIDFNIMEELRDKLVKAGLPKKEIGIIHEFPKKEDKQIAFDRMNSGSLRILMGSTDKMGTGANMQRRLKALHHLDQPWRPDQVEQREGRIIRHGNEFHDDVDIYRYIGEPPADKLKIIDSDTGEPSEIEYPKSYDLQMYQQLARKQNFIEQFKEGKIDQRTMEDAAGAVTLNADMFRIAKAMATGNPDAMTKVKLEHDIQTASLLARSHETEQWRYRSQRTQQQMWLATLGQRISELDGVREKWAKADNGKKFSAALGDRTFDSKEDFQKYLKANPMPRPDIASMTLYGIDLPIRLSNNVKGAQIFEYSLPADTAEWHVINHEANDVLPAMYRSATARLRELDGYAARLADFRANAQEKIEKLNADIDKPSPYADKLKAMRAELQEIDKRLGIGKDVAKQDEIGDPNAEPDEEDDGGVTLGMYILPGLPQAAQLIGKALRPAAVALKNFIESEADKNQQARELQNGLYTLESQYQADVLRAVQLLKQVPGTAEDEEAVYHHLEDPDLPLSKTQDDIMEEYVMPLMYEAERIYSKLSDGGMPVENYVHRVVQEKGNFIDRIMAGAKRAGTGSVLKQSSPALKGRTMMALQGPDGDRIVVAVKGGRVTRFDNGTATDMGSLKGGLTTRGGILEARIAPIDAKIKKLEFERDVLKATPSRVKVTFARRKNISEEIDQLEKQKDAIMASVPESELKDTVFRDKDQKQWTFDQATTKEIEANTDMKYYHNAMASALTNFLSMRKAERAFDYLESFKTAPDFDRVAFKSGNGNPPKDWRMSQVPQFRDYYFEPHTAEVLDWYADRLKSGAPSIFEKLGNFLRTSIFFNPLIHIPNISVHWVEEKGIRGWLPDQYPWAVKAGLKAINAVVHQNKDFLEALDAGAPLQSQRDATRELVPLFFENLKKQLEANPTAAEKMANALGYARPDKLISAIYKLAGKATWVSNDIAFLQSTYEKTARGMSLSDALKETAKHIPDYRLPTRIFDSSTLAKLMSNPNISMFGAYHYGALKSYGEMIKSLTGKSEQPDQEEGGRPKAGEAVHGADLLAFLGIITFLAYPLLDRLLRKATGNENARLRRAGAATLPFNLGQLSKGEKTPPEVLESIVTPAVHTKALTEMALNRDLRTGRHIYDPHAPAATIAKQVGVRAGSSLAPFGQAAKMYEDRQYWSKFLYGLGGITFPKQGAEKIAEEIALDKLPAEAPTPEAKREYLLRKKLLDSAREGDYGALETAQYEGKVSLKEARKISRDALRDPLEVQVQDFSLEELQRVYDAATDEQKEMLYPILQRKLARQLRNNPEEEGEQ